MINFVKCLPESLGNPIPEFYEKQRNITDSGAFFPVNMSHLTQLSQIGVSKAQMISALTVRFCGNRKELLSAHSNYLSGERVDALGAPGTLPLPPPPGLSIKTCY